MTIVSLTLRSLLGRKRVWLLLPLPVLLIGLTLLGHLNDTVDTDWIRPIEQGLGFGVVVPVMALIIGASVIGSEIDDGTIVHILTKPLPRREILLAKLVVAAAVTAITTGATMFVAGIIANGLRFGIGLAVGAAVASCCYCALFVALSLVSRRPVLVGLVYILLWEGLLTHVLTSGGVISIEAYAVTIADRIAGNSLLDTSVSVRTAIIMAIVFAVGGAWLGINRLKSFMLAGETN
ncbi:MAG TPA: ABC transporter permease subunit [Micromonosporaceae bacterium]